MDDINITQRDVVKPKYCTNDPGAIPSHVVLCISMFCSMYMDGRWACDGKVCCGYVRRNTYRNVDTSKIACL